MRVLLAGDATEKDIRRFFNLAYEWRLNSRIYKSELSNMSAGEPEGYIFSKDKELLTIYNSGIKLYEE